MAAFDKNHRSLSEDRKGAVTQKAIPILYKLSKFAEDHGVYMLLEPLNRYSTPFCSTARDAVDIASKVNQDNFGILLDTFHMNIEEDTFEDAISKSRKLLRHMHFADNNRKMPGYAHTNFLSIIRSLASIGYNGYASFEPTIVDKNYETSTRKGLEYIRSIEKSLTSASLSSPSSFSNSVVVN
jgi:D-psicose/D-tagatose/L-ribulose 3-epimerase